METVSGIVMSFLMEDIQYFAIGATYEGSSWNGHCYEQALDSEGTCALATTYPSTCGDGSQYHPANWSKMGRPESVSGQSGQGFYLGIAD
jgi:hypothetical protein